MVETTVPSDFNATDRLKAEVLIVLVGTANIWMRCKASENRPGVATTELLDELESRFPDSAWTLDILLVLLPKMSKGGLVVQFPVDVWYANSSLLFANYACNLKFARFFPNPCSPCVPMNYQNIV